MAKMIAVRCSKYFTADWFGEKKEKLINSIGRYFVGGINIQESLLYDENDLFIAKVILVIFYPFNACMNPFLYAIVTKQFQKDCLQALNTCGLCKRKIRGPRRVRQDDSVMSTKHNIVRNQSHISNTTQLTNVTSLSTGEQTRGKLLMTTK